MVGLILRRCTLDAAGLASWESPAHVKCVSKNYENIQTLVSPEIIPQPHLLPPQPHLLYPHVLFPSSEMKTLNMKVSD